MDQADATDVTPAKRATEGKKMRAETEALPPLNNTNPSNQHAPQTQG